MNSAFWRYFFAPLTALIVLVVPGAAYADDGATDLTNGCTATYPLMPTCTFRAGSSAIRWIAAGHGAWMIEIWRDGRFVDRMGSTLSEINSAPVLPGDVIVAKTTGVVCRLDVRDAS